MRFSEWMNNRTLGTDEVEDKVNQVYDKAKYAIKLAQIYSSTAPGSDRNLLKDISTVAPLDSGVYGLYNSAENKAVIGPAVANSTRFKFGAEQMNQQNDIQRLPVNVIRKYIPDIPPNQIKPSDVVRVNVRRIVRELGDTLEAVLQIASTIVHEATHEREYRTTGRTDETGPKRAEAHFMNWARTNMDAIVRKIPELGKFATAQSTNTTYRPWTSPGM
jgi:hypothetical protein